MKIETGQAVGLVSSLLGNGSWQCRPFGAGKFSQTFAVTGADPSLQVLRVAPPDSLLQLFYEYRMMRQEPAVHRRLLAETSVPVPEIIGFDFSRQLIDRDFLIMPRLPGQPLSRAGLDQSASRRAMREWGGYVADIHMLTEPENRFGYVGEHRCMEPRGTWREAFLTMYGKELEDIVSCGVYDRAISEQAMALLENNQHVLESCATSRLCHGDLWVTNLLVGEGGGVTGVIDFDRACWGDTEWDLAIAEYCGVAGSAFWDGYGKTVDTHRGEAAIRRFFYLLYEHQKYIVISMSNRRNDSARARRYADESLSAMEHFRRTGEPIF